MKVALLVLVFNLPAVSNDPFDINLCSYLIKMNQNKAEKILFQDYYSLKISRLIKLIAFIVGGREFL